MRYAVNPIRPESREPMDAKAVNSKEPVDWPSVGVGFLVIFALLLAIGLILSNPDRRKKHDPRVRLILTSQNIQLKQGESYNIRLRMFRKNLFSRWEERHFSEKRYQVTIQQTERKGGHRMETRGTHIVARTVGNYRLRVQVRSIPGLSRYRVHRSIPLHIAVKPR